MSTEQDEREWTAMVPYREPDKATQAIAAWEGQQQSLRSSLDLTTSDGKEKLFKLTATGQLNGSTVGGKTLHVTDWLVSYSAGFENDEGEIVEGLRLALLGSDGTTFHTFSMTAIKDFGMVLRMYGNGPWSPPLQIGFVSKPRRKGPGSYLQIASVCQGEPAKPAKK